MRSAAAARFGRARKEVFYEHGHWWVRINPMSDEPATDDVVDTSGGFGFERID